MNELTQIFCQWIKDEAISLILKNPITTNEIQRDKMRLEALEEELKRIYDIEYRNELEPGSGLWITFHEHITNSIQWNVLAIELIKNVTWTQNKYLTVVFFQGDSAIEVLNLFDEKGENAAFEYMLEYDTEPENDQFKEWSDINPQDTNDHTYSHSVNNENFIASFNFRLGYAGLSKIKTF